MKLKIYENSIVAPLKCGTRFLDSIWKPFLINETNLYSHCLNNKIKYIVVRSPLEHFKSAIQTETIGMLKECRKGNRFDDFKNTYIDSLSSNKNTRHWSNTLYEIILKIKEENTSNIQIIKLENLSDFINNRLGFNIPYKKETYNFINDKYFIEREELFNFYKNQSPEKFNILLEMVANQTKIYEKLILDTFVKVKKILV